MSRTVRPQPSPAASAATAPPITGRDGTGPDRPGRVGTAMRRRPITAFLTLLLAPTLIVYVVVIATGAPFMAAMGFELIALLAAPIAVTAAISGRSGVRQLYAGVTRWRFGIAWWLVTLGALPAIAVLVAVLTGSLQHPDGGWSHAALRFLLVFVAVAVTGNLWEESAWTGFLQTRWMDRHGLLIGSLLTAIPFTVIHLPLAFQDGLHAVTTRDVLTTWAFLIAMAPFMRYLLGVVLLDTGRSTLAVGLLHASFNATLAAAFFQGGGWQALVALVVLTLAVAAVHARRARR